MDITQNGGKAISAEIVIIDQTGGYAVDMSESPLKARLESVAESIVFAEKADLPALAAIHTELQAIHRWVMEAGYANAAAAVAEAEGLIESIILEEAPDAQSALDAVGRTIALLQQVVRDGRDPAEVDFSAAMRVDVPQTQTSTKTAAEKISTQQPISRKLEADVDLLREFVAEAREHLQNAEVHLLTIETNPEDADALNAVFRAFHTIKGVAGFLALGEIQKLAHESESLLDKARKGDLRLTGGYTDLTFESVDLLKRLVEHVAQSLAAGEDLAEEPGLLDLVERLKQSTSGKAPEVAQPVEVAGKTLLGEILVEKGATQEPVVAKALNKQQATPQAIQIGEMLVEQSIISRSQLEQALAIQAEQTEKSAIGDLLVEMGAVRKIDIQRALESQRHPQPKPVGEILVREGDAKAKDVVQALRTQKQLRHAAVEVREALKVDADRLDRLIDLIGELVIAESMVRQSPELVEIVSPILARQLGQLGKITRELQEMGMSLRMVPIKPTFQKMARLVRDLAHKSGKAVNFVTSGEDTEMDKSVVDRIGDPLVHMVRNSVDHGIEASADARTAAGKDAAGTVELRAFHRGGNIVVEIQDDGRGLDREAILAKAKEKGLIQGADTLSDREVWNLIFEPGFSTAKTVTDVSGRGVGMDVVRRNIEALRGQVEIHSVPGKGSTFSIRLPLTLAIIDGMVVRVGDERFIIPTLSVVRSIKPSPGDLVTVIGRGTMLNLKGELIPVFPLARLFDTYRNEGQDDSMIVVIVEDEGRRIGLAIDELLGKQQTVIKSLGEALRDVPGIAGGAIMADGAIGLIVDVAGVSRLAASVPAARMNE